MTPQSSLSASSESSPFGLSAIKTLEQLILVPLLAQNKATVDAVKEIVAPLFVQQNVVEDNMVPKNVAKLESECAVQLKQISMMESQYASMQAQQTKTQDREDKLRDAELSRDTLEKAREDKKDELNRKERTDNNKLIYGLLSQFATGKKVKKKDQRKKDEDEDDDGDEV